MSDVTGTESLLHAHKQTPAPGEIWGGTGSTFIVYEIWEDDARVYFLTGRKGLVKKPTQRAFVSLRLFTGGRLKPLDLAQDNVWTRAIAERYVYSPPDSQDDPRVCGRCRRSWGSRLVTPRSGHFAIFNWLTGKYHSGGDGGDTSCGLHATGGEWLWPI